MCSAPAGPQPCTEQAGGRQRRRRSSACGPAAAGTFARNAGTARPSPAPPPHAAPATTWATARVTHRQSPWQPAPAMLRLLGALMRTQPGQPRPSPVRAAEAQQPEPEADFLGFSGPGEAPAPSARATAQVCSRSGLQGHPCRAGCATLP